MPRPNFPKRALITGGMPYGNKDLHSGHIGGVFVPADIFVRFLRARIGKENVIFVSGTDCYGSPIVAYYRNLTKENKFSGSIEEFVKSNHEIQKEVLKSYDISLSLFSASALGHAKEIHEELGAEIINTLYKNGHLQKLSSLQFYDAKVGTFLNGRQVLGNCPIPGCNSEEAYADECSLGHPYEPKNLINPKSTLSGEKPEMRSISNWYVNLEKFRQELNKWIDKAAHEPFAREFAIKAINEFLEPPAIYVKEDALELLKAMEHELPEHKTEVQKGRPIKLTLKNLEEREKATEILSKHNLRFRTGKALVPFRLTGNIEWGLKAPDIEDLKNLTFWVWPESLWAPISFTKTLLESRGESKEAWKDWWCKNDSQVFQFIGEDNVFFYGPAEMCIFMGMQTGNPTSIPKDGDLKLPELITNKHLLFFDKKASSSGKIKPPMARDLLNHYTSDQLRAHFFALGLGSANVPFRPKPYNPNANPKEGDPVLKEGNLLSNVFNRAVRSCFYTLQKHFGGNLPDGNISLKIKEDADKLILQYEELMYKHEFHSIMSLLDIYIREINKYWSTNMKIENDQVIDAHRQAFIDVFHMIKVSTQLMNPIAPKGTEMIREYLNIGEDFWSWEHIFEPLSFFIKKTPNHKFKILEPRIDFFPKHPSQIESF